MNYRDLVNKLEAIERGDTISEAITIKDVAAAVQGKADQQERAKILNDLAWKENLPGLYDPTDGSYIGRQSAAMPGSQYSVSGTASKDDDAALAKLGLIPKNAQTSSALGKFFGTSGDMYDKGVRSSNDAVVAQQEKAELIKTSLAKLSELMKKLQDVVAKGSTPAQPKPVAESFSKSLVESFGYTAEEQTEEGVLGTAGKLLGRAAPGAGAGLGGMEAAERWKEGDYLGAGLAGLSGAFSLAGPLGWIPAVGLAAINMGRDAAKEKAAPAAQGAAATTKPGTNLGIAQMQKELGVAADGIIGPITTAAMAKNPQLAAKYGFGPDGKPLPKKESVQMKTVAEQYRELVNKLELIEVGGEIIPGMVDPSISDQEEIPPEIAAQAKPASAEDQALDAKIEQAGGSYALQGGQKYILMPTPGNESKPTVINKDTMKIVDATKPGLPVIGDFDPSQLAETYGLDEGLWDSIFKGAMNLGKNFKGGYKGYRARMPNGTYAKPGSAAELSNRAGQGVKGAVDFTKANPIKTGVGVGALGYTAGSLAGGPDSTTGGSSGQSGSTGQSGSGQGAAATPATPTTPTANPEVQAIVDEIRKLMADMGKIDDPTVKDAIGKATQQIDAIPGVKKPA